MYRLPMDIPSESPHRHLNRRSIVTRSLSVFGTETRRGLRRKAVSSVELTQLLLDRIERHNPVLNSCRITDENLAIDSGESQG